MPEIMLFPLSSVILPEGKMRLRIFEPRYKRLVSQAMKSDGTFGICLYDREGVASGEELSQIGTLAKITDFELLEDGLLGISVTGITKFKILRVRTEHDGLRLAKVEWMPNWNETDIDTTEEPVVTHLGRIYEQFPEIGDLYEHKFFDDASWVSQRWLEILPLSNHQFDSLVMEKDCSGTLDFLRRTLDDTMVQ